MTVAIISRSISTKIWDRAVIEPVTPGCQIPDALPTALRDPLQKTDDKKRKRYEH